MAENRRASFVCESQHDHAQVINKDALGRIPKEKVQELFKINTIYENKFRVRAGVQNVISRSKYQYEEEVKNSPYNYESWFDYLRLMESEGDIDATREVYERAIANVPLMKVKRYWRRYIDLWISYALFEELQVKPVAEDRTRQVYQACLKVIPHSLFTFSKIWLLAAQYEIGENNLTAARKILDTAIRRCHTDKLFRSYIDLEFQLKEFDICRVLCDHYVLFFRENCITWMTTNRILEKCF